MCDIPPTPIGLPRYRDPVLRAKAAAMKADRVPYAEIGRRLSVSAATVQRLVAPLPSAEAEPPAATCCRQCGRAKVNRPRGLCWRCYYTPGLKDQFPSSSKYGRRGVTAPRGVRPLPTPTTAPAGSAEKVEILARRAGQGLRLWRPADHQAERPPERVETRVHRVAFDDR